MYAFILIKQATFTSTSAQKLNKIQDQRRILYLTLHAHGGEMGEGEAWWWLSMVRGGFLRWWVAVGGHRWPLNWPKGAPCTAAQKGGK